MENLAKSPKEASSLVSDSQLSEKEKPILFRIEDGKVAFPNGKTLQFDPYIWFLLTRDSQVERYTGVPEHSELELEIQQRLGRFASDAFARSNIEFVDVRKGYNRKTTTYTFNPDIRVIDMRNQLQDTASPLEYIRRINTTRDLYDANTRETIFKALLDAYTGHAQIFETLKRLRKDGIEPRFDSQGSLIIDDPPDSAETKKYLLQLEIGMTAFFEEQNTQLAEAAILDMIEAYYSLLFKHAGLVKKHAAHYRKSDQMTFYDSLCHEAYIVLMNLIVEYISYRKVVKEDGITGEDAQSVRSQFTDDASDREFADIAEAEIMNAMRKIRGFEQRAKPANRGTHHRSLSKKRLKDVQHDLLKVESEFDNILKNANLQNEIADLMQAHILTEREKIVLSLYSGLFIEGLRGAEFKPGYESFTYPEVASDMPTSPLTIGQISERLKVRQSSVKAILHVALRACRMYLEEQGLESLDEIMT